MADKGKGNQSSSGKKQKAAKEGHRPHEERQREALSKTDELKSHPPKR
jgi:hypothetical protein